MNKKILSWDEFYSLGVSLAGAIKKLGRRYNDIYAIPRGGVPLGVLLSEQLKLKMVNKPIGSFTLIVDDICDSGRTLSGYQDYDKAVLFHKIRASVKPIYIGQTTDKWIEFPWEIGEASSEDAVVRIIEAIGDDPNREGLKNTPRRVIKSWGELFSGYGQDPKKILSVTFEEGMEKVDEIVICKNIEFYSTCEHHMLPIVGTAHVGYIPNKKVVGLSKLARLVECFARRLQIQEQLTSQIANSLMESLEPEGVGVIINAKHFCMCARGVNKQSSSMTTSSMLGALRDKPEARAEFLKLCEMS